MCTLSVRMDDQVIDRVKPLFDGDSDMNRWIEMVLRKAMLEYAEQFAHQQEQERENTLILARLKALEGDPDAFFKMTGILGKPRAGFHGMNLEKRQFTKNTAYENLR